MFDGNSDNDVDSEDADVTNYANSKPRTYYVYFLALDAPVGTTGQKTYIGATVDLEHRLRQHNKELVGGAHVTGAQVERGYKWRRVCYVTGFPTWQAALQFEWRWKNMSRKKEYVKLQPIEKRLAAMKAILALDRSTSKAVPFAEWPSQPQIVFSNTIDYNIYMRL